MWKNSEYKRQWVALKYGLVVRKPKFLSRIARHYAETFIFKKRPLRYVDFAVDYRCNLNCVHCFKTVLEDNRSFEPLQIEDYRNIARQCIDLGVLHFSLQGGEITLFKDLEKLVRAMSPEKVLFSLTTNGMFLEEDAVKNYYRWGVDIINVSLDSGIAEEHDQFRLAPGCFEKAMSGIRRARMTGLQVTINTTVSGYNLYSQGFAKLVEFCTNEKILLNIILAAPSGNWKGNVGAVVSADDMKYIRALIQSSPYLRHDSDSIHLGRGCPALKEVIYITPYGDILTCPFIHISMGNLQKETLKHIRDRGMEYHFFNEHSKQCLVAQEDKFIKKYISKTFGRDDLPLSYREVFGSPEEAKAEYSLVEEGVTLPKASHELVQEWKDRVQESAKSDFYKMTFDAREQKRDLRKRAIT